jgi:hypothetical protein
MPIRETQEENQSELQGLTKSFLFGLKAIAMNSSREPGYYENHLLSFLFQDLLESSIALSLLVHEGILNCARRELRFILEASVKLCLVQQDAVPDSSMRPAERRPPVSVSEKIDAFKKELNSPSISTRNLVHIYLLGDEKTTSEFQQEVGRLYGELSGYTHLSARQVQERMISVQAGRFAGFEAAEDVGRFYCLAERVLACSMVFIMHSVYDWVVGDLLVESDGSSLDWKLAESRFIARIDEYFDYKYERQGRLAELRSARAMKVRC